MATPCLDPKFENAIRGSYFPVCILANPQLSDFVLLDLAEGELAEAVQRHIQDKPRCFVGVAALGPKGEPRAALNFDLGQPEIDILSAAYLAHIDNRLSAMSSTPHARSTPRAN